MNPRYRLLTDARWELLAPYLPSSAGRAGRPFNDHRLMTEGIIYRYRAGIPWRDLPEHYGPWQSVWKRHRRYSSDGTWDTILGVLLSHADARGLINWEVSVDCPINRAHQHGTNLTRTQGELANHKNLLTEPPDHAIGRSRGGLSTTIHAVVDGNRRPLVLLPGAGQGRGRAHGREPAQRDPGGGNSAAARPAPAPIPRWRTRPTHPRRSARTCASAGSSA